MLMPSSSSRPASGLHPANGYSVKAPFGATVTYTLYVQWTPLKPATLGRPEAAGCFNQSLAVISGVLDFIKNLDNSKWLV